MAFVQQIRQFDDCAGLVITRQIYIAVTFLIANCKTRLQFPTELIVHLRFAVVELVLNIGDVKSLASHPASTTHRQLSEEELVLAGVTPDMIRLCIGIEDIEDILADLDQALASAGET